MYSMKCGLHGNFLSKSEGRKAAEEWGPDTALGHLALQSRCCRTEVDPSILGS